MQNLKGVPFNSLGTLRNLGVNSEKWTIYRVVCGLMKKIPVQKTQTKMIFEPELNRRIKEENSNFKFHTLSILLKRGPSGHTIISALIFH